MLVADGILVGVAGVSDADTGLARAAEYGGNVRGSDNYADASSGVILGSSHHGDHELARRAAWLGARSDPQRKGTDRDYGDVGNAVLRPDTRTVDHSVRAPDRPSENGRDAIVLIDTAAIPD